MTLKILMVLLFVAALGIVVVYAGSLDWSRAHSKHVSGLPLYAAGSGDGEYRIKASGLEFRARLAGQDNHGSQVLLLHGFPESSIMWEDLIQDLIQAGHRVVAFDQRGYSPGARPSGVDSYSIDGLRDDVFAVADAVGFDKFHLVAHDWGAVVGWHAVLTRPERITSWTAMAIPHITAFFDGLSRNPDQKRRSAYMDRLRQPMLPEFLFMYWKQHNMKRLMHRLPPEQLQEYLAILSEPGAMTAVLNWYRSLDPEAYLSRDESRNQIEPPTLFIWGTEDAIISPSVVESQAALFDSQYTELKLPVGHNPVQQDPKSVTEAVIKHLQRADS